MLGIYHDHLECDNHVFEQFVVGCCPTQTPLKHCLHLYICCICNNF